MKRLLGRISVITRNMSMASGSELGQEILVSDVGVLRKVISLNRPQKLNALNTATLKQLGPIFKGLRADGISERLVVLRGEGAKAFCAGGDVGSLHEAISSGTKEEGKAKIKDFFDSEYPTLYATAHLAFPTLSLWDGITMGGGVGYSIHATYKVATEKTLFAMPETAIGLFPDVAASYFLTHYVDPKIGMFLGLSGYRLNGADLLRHGLATHHVPSADIPCLMETLASDDECLSKVGLGRVLDRFHKEPTYDPRVSAEMEQTVRKCFVVGPGTSLKESISALGRDGSPAAQEILTLLNRQSPFALRVTHEQLSRGMAMDLGQCFKMEYRLANRVTVEYPDFKEGVRAVLVDKDNTPAWEHPSIDDVDEDVVQSLFLPLSDIPDMDLYRYR